MNPIEKALFLPREDIKTWPICDAALVATFLFPEEMIIDSRDCHATVELMGLNTRGQLTIDPFNTKPTNVHMLEVIDDVACKEIFLWAADIENDESYLKFS